jgi:aminopeptidase N
VAKAKVHFQQVKRMLQSFEKVFGPYPFYEDGYKLVETPYWGMEHQSCVAYGNNYQNNKFGFDFIIVHESGHEWFANSITAADKADMWIHEGFTTYSECLYVEKQLGLPRAVNYIVGQKGNIKNNTPLIGPRGVNYNRTDNDLYYKGAWMLHTMRNVLDNDTLWFSTLKDLNEKFYHQIVSSKDIENFFIARTQYNFKPFFEQYLYHKKIPVIEYYLVQKDGLNELHYRLNADVKNLVLPVKVTLSKGKMDFLSFSRKWKIYDLPYSEEKDFLVDDKHFLVEANRIPNKQ